MVLAAALTITAAVVVTRVLPDRTPAARPPSASAPATPTTPSSAPALFTRDVKACALLTATQIRSLFGASMKRSFVHASSCTWNRPDGTYLAVSTYRYPKLAGARDHHKQMVQTMKGEPHRTPGTEVRTGPRAGDESYGFTQHSTVGASGPYRAQITFRLTNVVVLVIHHNARRAGYTLTADTAKLLAAAVDRRR
ncbi:DUF3558 family protein [Nonomuraea typhae]|uniref:DUF3558 family protein n=1 Tax=Nonomuraea typhae TaxID=2603600 RepID=A0ABW7YQB9_9ACTN